MNCHEQQYPLSGGGIFPLQWRLSLDELIKELERLPAMTEIRFLKVGSMLHEISSMLQTIGNSADKAAMMMSGEESLSVISDLEQILDRLEDEFLAEDRTAGQVDNLLSGILGELDNMDRLLDGFKGHVGNLRSLKLLTNIQVASLSERGMGFRAVAAAIGVLSQNIHRKSNAILPRIKTLRSDLVKGRTMVTSLGITLNQLKRTIVCVVRSKIAVMAEMHGNCSIATRDLSSRSGEISRNIGSLVVTLQFQDITRQQMEHARDALVGMQKRILSERTPETTGRLFDELADICALQSAQLANSANALVNAVTGIASSLQAVANEASDSAAQVHGLFQQADEVGRSSLADIELSLTSLSGAFTENLIARESLADIILATTAAMEEITGFAGEIDFLGSEIRLIALNAIIKAAQTGKDGTAFSVIAENIKQQSDDICRQAATINTAIQAITRNVINLHKEMTEEGNRATVLRTDELEISVGHLKGFIDNAAELLLSTDKAADSMAKILAETTAALSSSELIATVQRDLIPRIKWLSAGFGLHESLPNNFQGAELRYTMESERAVHQKFVSGAESGYWDDEPGNSFFPSPVGDGHFKRNVELF